MNLKEKSEAQRFGAEDQLDKLRLLDASLSVHI